MSEAPPDWDSFFDLTTPAEAAALLRAEHGANALQAAENCATMALADGRLIDQQFWMAVTAELKAKSH